MENRPISQNAGAKSGAVDAELREVIRVWPTLPYALKAAVLAVVRTHGHLK
jgi:hypothetical protein